MKGDAVIRETVESINNLFRKHSREIAERNLRLMRTLCWLYLCCLALYYYIVCLRQNNSQQDMALLLAVCFQSLFIVVVWSIKQDRPAPWLVNWLLMVFGASIVVPVIYLGTVVFPDNSAVLFPLVLIMMTQFYTFSPKYELPLMFLSVAAFLICSVLLKSREIFLLDATSTVMAVLIALAAYFASLKSKADDMQKRDGLQYISCHDPLTGLLNRTAFRELFEKIMDSGEAARYAIVIIDLDKFKHINDRFGHLTGDRVLQNFARVIRKCFGTEEADVPIGRFGGDEFLVFIPSVKNNDVAKFLNRFYTSGDELSAGVSFDVACSSGVVIASDASYSLDYLLSRADEALYEVKNSGGGKYVVKQI